jgi:hypothetical protein
MTKKVFTAQSAPAAHEMPPFEMEDIHAFKALLAGKATAEQQVRFLVWFKKATGVNTNPYRPGGEEGRRDTDLACGRKLVGDWFLAVAEFQPRGIPQR